MKKEELLEFITSGENNLEIYEQRVLESFTAHSKLVNRYVIAIIVFCVAYLLSESGDNVEFNFLSINLGSDTPLKPYYPVIISVLFLLAVKASKYLANLIVVYKTVFSRRFQIEENDVLITEKTIDQFSRLVLPFRPFLELMYNTGSGCWNKFFNMIFTGIPVLCIQLIPISIVVYSSCKTINSDMVFIDYVLLVIQGLSLVTGLVTFFSYIAWSLKFNKII